jgi:hypothetical protein
MKKIGRKKKLSAEARRLGRRGGKKAARNMTPEARHLRAQRAALCLWEKRRALVPVPEEMQAQAPEEMQAPEAPAN